LARFSQAGVLAFSRASSVYLRRHVVLPACREEVAVLAGVSVSWYTWLEQGRDIQPSADALKRISKASSAPFAYESPM
jgi:transcriptional regulator with XRE-family HTH domain